MTTAYAIALVEEVNDRLSPTGVLEAIDFHADKVQQAGDIIKAFCPIHKDSRFRSLLMDADRRAFRCTMKTCAGYSGGTLVDLYALALDKPVLAATCELAQRLESPLLDGWLDNLVESYQVEAAAAYERADYTEAETLLRELTQVVPQMIQPRILLAALHDELGDTQQATEEYVRIIDDAIAYGETDEAIGLVNDILKRYPQNEDIRFASVRVAEAIGNHELAIARMQDILALREAENRQMDNIGLLEEIVKKAPERPEFMIRLGALYEQQHNVRAASRQYEDAAAQFAKTGDLASATEWLEKVVQFNAENIRARMQLADLLVQFGEKDKARDHIFRIANQHIDQQEFGPATTVINGWLEKEPENISARELLARVHLEQELPSEAAAYLVEGADIAAKNDDNTAASELLLRAKYMAPENVELRRKLIDQFNLMGETQRAAFERIDLAEMFFSADDPAAAVEILDEAVASDVSLSLKLQIINSLVTRGQMDSVKHHVAHVEPLLADASPESQSEFYELQSRLDPASVETRLRLVNSLWEQAPPRALEAATEAITALSRLGNTTGAIELLQVIADRIETHIPGSPALLKAAAQTGRVDLIGKIYQAIVQGLADEDIEAALNLARWMAEADPHHPSASSDIAFLLAAMGQTAEAAEQYASVAELLRLAGDFPAGLQYAQEATALEPGSVPALAVHARLAREVLGEEEAAAAAQALLSSLPNADSPAAAEAGYLAAAELFPQDVALLEQGANVLLQLGSHGTAAHLNVALAHNFSEQGNWTAAHEKLKHASHLAPDDPVIWEHLGLAGKATDNASEAAEAFARASLNYAAISHPDDAARCVELARSVSTKDPAVLEIVFAAAEKASRTDIATEVAAELTQISQTAKSASSTARWAREWVRVSPRSAAAHEALGHALAAAEQIEKAAESLSAAARLYHESKNDKKALEALKLPVNSGVASPDDLSLLELIVSSPTSPPEQKSTATILLGNAYLKSSNLDEAARLAESADPAVAAEIWPGIARAQDATVPNAQTAWRRGADALNSIDQTDAAIGLLREALKAGVNDTGIHAALAPLLIKTDKGSEALDHLLRVISSTASSDNSKFQSTLEMARSVAGEHIQSLIRIAQILVSANRREVALTDLEKAAELSRQARDSSALIQICALDEELTRSSSILTRARADALMGMENEQQALDWVQENTLRLLDEGNFAEAAGMADRWMQLRPQEIEPRRHFSIACASSGRQEDADHADLETARLLISQENPAGAVDILTQLSQRNSENPEIQKLLVEAHRATGNSAAAASAICSLAELYENAGDFDAALASYSECLTFDDQNAHALHRLAELTLQRDNEAAALPLYRNWLKVRETQVEKSQWVEDLKQVLEIAPESSVILRKLSSALLNLDRNDEALPYLSDLATALELEENFVAAAQVTEELIAQKQTPPPKDHLAASRLYQLADMMEPAQEHLRLAATAYHERNEFTEAAKTLDKLLDLSGDAADPEDFALAATAHHKAGTRNIAIQHIGQALERIADVPSHEQRKEKILLRAMEIDPLNPVYVTDRMEQLPLSQAMTVGMRAADAMQEAGKHEQALQVLTQVVALVPHDMSVRERLFEPLRATGDKVRLRQELVALASDALAAGDSDAAVDALNEAQDLAETAQQYRTLAELNERARRLDRASELFARAARLFADDDKTEPAVASINRAMSFRQDAIPAEIMTDLIARLGAAVYEPAREQLRKALSGRKQAHSQMLAMALMAALPEKTPEIMKTVYTLGGSSILAGIAYARVNTLLESNRLPETMTLMALLMEIAPDSSDMWHLSARVNYKAGNYPDSVRAALEAARLYAMAGAVIEEEEAYLQAIEADPADPTIRSTFAEFLVREHRPDEAVSQLQSAVEQAQLSHNTDLQLEALNRAVQIAPANVDLREKLAALLEKIAPDSAIENWLQAAKLYNEAGEADRARRTLQHVLALNPRNESALSELMLVARRDADLLTAAKLVSRLAEVKAARKNIGEAVRLLQTHLEIDPDNLEILEQLSTFAGASNDNEVFVTTSSALARKFQKMGDNASALRHYEAVLERKPRDANLLTTILDCCAAAGNSEKGLAYARQLLAVARETEDPEKIRVAAATILNFDESDAEARRELAESLLSLNRVPEAVTEFMRAAELFEGAGSTANAFVCYRRATQISPATAQAWRRFADLSLTIGDLESARLAMGRVVESVVPADSTRIQPLVDRMLQVAGDEAELHQMALDFYRRVNNAKGAALEATWLANHAADSGDPDRAEVLFHEAELLDPANREIKAAHYNFIRKVGRLEELQMRLRHEAEEHLAAGDSDKAIESLKELADLATGQVGVHRDLAKLLEAADRPEEALEQYLKVVELLLERSELEEARETAENLVARFSETSNCREQVADLLAKSAYPDLAARYYSTAADSAVLQEDYDRAVHLLEKAVDARPLWASARSALASAYEKAGQSDEAFKATINLVSVLLENGEFLDATSTLTRLSKEHPERPEVRERLAELYEKTGRRNEYIQMLRELTDFYEQTEDQEKLLSAYHRLSQAAPEDAVAIQRYVELASAQTESASPEKMTQEFTRLADVLLKSGDVEGAFQAYEQVLAQSPENTSARSRYAAFLLARGSRNRAVGEMRTLANLYIKRGEPAAAAEVLNAAMAVTPRDAELCLELAKAQESAGLIEEARVSYSRASAILANTAAVKGIDTYRRILSIDECNTAVRLRLVDLLMKTGDKMEAAREARTLAEIHVSRGELAEAQHAYALVDECEPSSLDQIKDAIHRDSYDPSLQYLHYVRLGNCLFANGDIDNALDAYRTARSLYDDQVDLIQKCIDCLSLIAPEAEAIPDYLVMAEKQVLAGDMLKARQTYEKVRLIDPFNNDARGGLESLDATEAHRAAGKEKPAQDNVVLKTTRSTAKRVALRDLLAACQDAAAEQSQGRDGDSAIPSPRSK